MPDLQSTDPGRKLQQRYNLSKPDTPFLSPELVPVVLVDDLTGASVWALEFERLCAGHSIRTVPPAGQWARVLLINPPDSGVIATVEKCWVALTAGPGTLQIDVTRGFTPVVDVARWRDTRLSGAPACGTAPSQILVTPPPPTFIHQDVFNEQWLQTEYVLAPNSVFEIVSTIEAVGVGASIWWSERTIFGKEESVQL